MATVNKDFKIKSGLIVEGTTGTINGEDILTTSQASTDHIIGIVGGQTLITSVESTQLEVVSGELNVKANVFDAYGSAADAETAANSYTDGEITTALTTAQGYADTAEADAKSYADGLAVNYDPAGSAASAETAANNYTNTALLDYTTTANLDTTIDGYGYLKSADLSGYATETYVNTAVDNLVDGAPGLLDTLNELAAAINDDANYATTITTALAGKQATLTPGSNIDITADTISVTGLDTDDVSEGTNLYFTDQRALDATSSAYDAAGAAATAQSNAETFATNAINALDTDDIEEGATNVYFTDGRAKDSAASLLTSATLTNITITGTGNGGLTITAENGVADSNTDDLAEGSENLYFTDERAIDAVSNADIYPNAVILDNVAKQIAASLTATTAGVHVATAFAKAEYRTAEFLVKVAYGDHTEISKVLLTLDVNDNIAITEYGVVGTNGSGMSVTAAINGANVELRVTTANNNSTVTVVGTLLV
jgi:hypothetical protein